MQWSFDRTQSACRREVRFKAGFTTTIFRKIQFLIIRTAGLAGSAGKKEADLCCLGRGECFRAGIAVGVWERSEEARSIGGFEIQITRWKLQLAENTLFIKNTGSIFSRAPALIRTPRQSAILRIRSEIEHALRDFFTKGTLCCRCPDHYPSSL